MRLSIPKEQERKFRILISLQDNMVKKAIQEKILGDIMWKDTIRKDY